METISEDFQLYLYMCSVRRIDNVVVIYPPQANRGRCNREPSSDQKEDTTKHAMKSISSFFIHNPLPPQKNGNKTD